MSKNSVKFVAKDAWTSSELHLELSRCPDLTTPTMPHQTMEGLEVDIAHCLGSSATFKKDCYTRHVIVVEDAQNWNVPSHLHVKHKRDFTLEKVHYLIELREIHTPALKLKGICKSGSRNSHTTLEDLRPLLDKIFCQ